MITKTMLLIFIILLYFYNLTAQQAITEGNLLRIDITKNDINYNDTLWNWKDIHNWDNEYNNSCLRIFSFNSELYLLTHESYYHYYFSSGWGNYKIINASSGKENIVRSWGYVLDVIGEPYLSLSNNILITENGFWFLGGIYVCTFFNKNDSTYSFYSKSKVDIRLTHVIGKINNDYLIAVRRELGRNDYDFFLSDLSITPSIQLDNKITFDYSGFSNSVPTKIYHLRDSLYLLNLEGAANTYLASFSNNTIKIIKPLFVNVVNWIFYDDEIIYSEYDSSTNTFGLMKSKFISATLSFEEKHVVVPGLSFPFVHDNKYIACLRNDSLLVYNHQENMLARIYSLKGIKYKSEIFLSAPFLFISQINTITGIEQGKNIPEYYSLSQNYPNPFNPTTIIKYSIPASLNPSKGGTLVSLKVYDVLGREVTTLVNEEKQPGNYEVKFDGSNISSGVYFYRLQAGSFTETKKFVLIK
mgnify:CR=1 FL=1